jgi:hypothetical protein
VIPYCDTPGQSVAAALLGGLLGGWLALALAGALGGAGDLLAHVVRGDAQFRAAVLQVRRRVDGS